MVPSTVVESGGRLVVQVIAPDNNIDVYYIDRFAGQQTGITLYTENNSARDYNLYDVTLDTSVHGIRGFRCHLGTDFDYVFLEIDGRLYMPYASDDVAETLINWNDDTFENAGDLEMAGFIPIVPKVEVEYSGESTVLRVPSFDNITVDVDEIIELYSVQEIAARKVDGIIVGLEASCICVNGVYKILAFNSTNAVGFETAPYQSAFSAVKSDNNTLTNIYDSDFTKILNEGASPSAGLSLQEAKESLESELGIQLSNETILCAEGSADLAAPFVMPTD